MKKASPNPGCCVGYWVRLHLGCAALAASQLLDPRGPALGLVLDDHPFQQLPDDGLLRLRHAGDGLELQRQVGVWRQLALLENQEIRRARAGCQVEVPRVSWTNQTILG